MDEAPLVYREEVTAIFFAILDIDTNTWAIRRLLEEDDDGEAAEDE